MSIVKCKGCGKQINSTAKFCPHCGKNQQEIVIKHKPTNLLITLFLIALLLSFIAYLVGNRNIKNTNNVQNYETKSNTVSTNIATFKDQLYLHKIRKKFLQEYKNADNDIQKSDVYSNAQETTLSFAKSHDLSFEGWEGKISDIKTNKGGGKLFLTIIANKLGQEIEFTTNYWNSCGIKKGDFVYNKVRNLSEGQKVTFGGKFLKNNNGKLDELSWTEKGSMVLPEYKVKFIDIEPNKTN